MTARHRSEHMEPDGNTSMSDASLSESTVEAVALDWLASLGWAVAYGPAIASGMPAAERADYGEVVLSERLRSALARLNPDLPTNALEDALHRMTRPAGATLEARNRDFHRMLVAGVTVEYVDTDGRVCGAQVRVLDFDEPDANDWVAINQFTVVENRHERRPDIVLFVNGLPLAVVELKNPMDEDATIWSAFQQLQTYKAEIPSLFVFNAALIMSDGLAARIGTLTAGREWCKPWRTISGEALADPSLPQLQVLLEGVFTRRRLLALVRDFIVFEDDGSGNLVKKMAGYHQFHAVQTAVTETLRAAALQQAVADLTPSGTRLYTLVHACTRLYTLVHACMGRVRGEACTAPRSLPEDRPHRPPAGATSAGELVRARPRRNAAAVERRPEPALQERVGRGDQANRRLL